MNKYLINEIKLKDSNLKIIITLLDYEIKISDYFKMISISSNSIFDRNIIIDAALCSGINEYRFLSSDLMNDGSLDINNCNYVDVDCDILYNANLIISKNPLYYHNSILTLSQINFFDKFN